MAAVARSLLLAILWLAGAFALVSAANGKDATPHASSCSTAEGQRISPTACIAIEPKISPDDLTLENDAALPTKKKLDYCPNIVLVEGQSARKRIVLPETSFLYDTSDCCPATELRLKANARRRRFSISGYGRDCFGGTAHFDVEESYRLDRSGKAKLLRRLDRSYKLKPVEK